MAGKKAKSKTAFPNSKSKAAFAKADVVKDKEIKDEKIVKKKDAEILSDDEALAPLLRVAQGSLLSSVSYSRAVEALVTAAKRGVASSEWRDAAVRLLQSRSNSPLALLWSYLAFQRAESESGDDVAALVAAAQSLLLSLKYVTTGLCSGPTAIVAAAPVAQLVVYALGVYARSGTRKEKLWRSLKKVMLELAGFVSLCHHKDAPVVNGLFKAPSGNVGLDIWLSESAEFGMLFPFASQLKVDGFLNSIESVLFLGEVVETEVALLRLVAAVVEARSSSDVEKILKHDVVSYGKFLGSSTVILDMLLDAPLQVCGILTEPEEVVVRDVLGEMAVAGVPNSEVFHALPNTGRDGVAFLKRVMIARRLAGEFRSRGEYLRASDLLSGLHLRGAPAALGEWLSERGSLRVLIGTAVLGKPQELVEWLVNASQADFNVVLEKAYIKTDGVVEDVPDALMDEVGEEALFFIDTSKSFHKDAGFDADEEFTVAAGNIQADTKDDVLFDRSEQVERKRIRAAGEGKAGKGKQRRNADATDSEDISMSEDDDSDDESGLSE